MKKTFKTTVPNWIFSRPELTPNDRLLMIYILSFKRCFMSQKGIAKTLGFSESTVHRSIKKLIKMGLVLASKKAGQSLQYSVNFEQPDTVTPTGLCEKTHRHPDGR
jgi:biotin operon repressor